MSIVGKGIDKTDDGDIAVVEHHYRRLVRTKNKTKIAITDLLRREEQKNASAIYKREKYEKHKKTTESREKIKEILELEKENFKIKVTEERKEKVDANGVKYLQNPEGDVRQPLEGKYAGEQYFTGDEFDIDGNVIKEGSATRETKKAGKRLPASWTTYKDIIKKKYAGSYLSFLRGELLKEDKIMFPGSRDQYSGKFKDIDRAFYFRCADGSCFHNRNIWHDNMFFKDSGFSVRCLK